MPPFAEIILTSTPLVATELIIVCMYKLVSLSKISLILINVPALESTLYALKTKTLAPISLAKSIAYCNVLDAFSLEPIGTKI